MRAQWIAVVNAALLACGPSAPSGEGEGDGTGSTTSGTVTTATSSSDGVTSDPSGEESGTGGRCPSGQIPIEPGCPPHLGPEIIPEAGCYFECGGAGDECPNGACFGVWIDPCAGLPCDACGGQAWLCLPPSEMGELCQDDLQCQSGICWDINAHDPFCFGGLCSAQCVTDQDCIDLATEAEIPLPDEATCGADQLCNLLCTGVGGYVCA